jgi:hypothetical protein
MSKTGEATVSYEEAKRRALAGMDTISARNPSGVAGVIWPRHNMKAQGAAFAASAILKRMEKDGLVRERRGVFGGWVLVVLK